MGTGASVTRPLSCENMWLQGSLQNQSPAATGTRTQQKSSVCHINGPSKLVRLKRHSQPRSHEGHATVITMAVSILCDTSRLSAQHVAAVTDYLRH